MCEICGRHDFMIYQSFYESICVLINNNRRKEAGELAMEMIRYGTTGVRHQYFDDCIMEATMRGFIPLIDKSNENYDRTVEASKNRKQIRHHKRQAAEVTDTVEYSKNNLN